jgi:hypothetical protein
MGTDRSGGFNSSGSGHDQLVLRRAVPGENTNGTFRRPWPGVRAQHYDVNDTYKKKRRRP